MHRSNRLIIRDAEFIDCVARSGDDVGIAAVERRWGMALTTIVDTLWDEAHEAGLCSVADGMEALYNWLTA